MFVRKNIKVKLPNGNVGTIHQLSNKTGNDGTMQVIVKTSTGKLVTTVKKLSLC